MSDSDDRAVIAWLVKAARATCPHGQRSMPQTCSQCLGVPVQRVTIEGNELHVDGVAIGRQVDHERVITARKTQRRRRKQ